MTDDFFDKIDTSLGKQKEQKETREALADQNLAFVRSLIPRLAEIAKDYECKCRERGMRVSVTQGDRTLAFELRYKDGGINSIIAGPSRDNGRLEFEGHFTNDDGKRYKSMPMESYDEESWTDSVFEQRLQKLISDFVFYADRHGGI